MHRWNVKPQVKSYLISVLVTALLLAGCATGPGGEQAQSRAASRVMSAYDVSDLLTQAAPAVAQSLKKNLPDEVDAQTRKKLRAAVFEAYDPQQLQAEVTDNLRKNARADDRQGALATAAQSLETPLAARMIGLEATSGEAGFAEGFKSFANQPATEQRKQRLRRIDTLAEDMQIIELQTAFNATLLETMIRARNVASPAQYQVPAERIDSMVDETRGNIKTQLDKRVPLMLLYVYRDVSDAELQEYAQLQAQPGLVWTNAALKKAIVSALASASERVRANFNNAS